MKKIVSFDLVIYFMFMLMLHYLLSRITKQ